MVSVVLLFVILRKLLSLASDKGCMLLANMVCIIFTTAFSIALSSALGHPQPLHYLHQREPFSLWGTVNTTYPPAQSITEEQRLHLSHPSTLQPPSVEKMWALPFGGSSRPWVSPCNTVMPANQVYDESKTSLLNYKCIQSPLHSLLQALLRKVKSILLGPPLCGKSQWKGHPRGQITLRDPAQALEGLRERQGVVGGQLWGVNESEREGHGKRGCLRSPALTTEVLPREP